MSPEQNYGVASVEDAWQLTVDALRAVTIQLIDVTDEERQSLSSDFWQSHVAILEKYEGLQPGITERVFSLFESRGEQEQQVIQEHFEKVVLPKAKRRAFIDGMLGRQVVTRLNSET